MKAFPWPSDEELQARARHGVARANVLGRFAFDLAMGGAEADSSCTFEELRLLETGDIPANLWVTAEDVRLERRDYIFEVWAAVRPPISGGPGIDLQLHRVFTHFGERSLVALAEADRDQMRRRLPDTPLEANERLDTLRGLEDKGMLEWGFILHTREESLDAVLDRVLAIEALVCPLTTRKIDRAIDRIPEVNSVIRDLHRPAIREVTLDIDTIEPPEQT